MMDGHQIALWNHTSAVMSLIANVNRGKNQRAWKPRDFHPYVKERAANQVTDKAAAFGLLKQLGGKDLAEVRYSNK